MTIVPFRLSSAKLTPHVATIAIEGDLDMYTSPALEELFLGLGDGVTHMLIDLTGVTFVDSSGISLLTQTARRLNRLGGQVVLAIDTVSVRRIFEVTGLDQYFVIHRDASRAVRQLLGDALIGVSE